MVPEDVLCVLSMCVTLQFLISRREHFRSRSGFYLMLSSLKVLLIKPKHKLPHVLTLATERTVLCKVFYVKLSTVVPYFFRLATVRKGDPLMEGM